jgi:hypothetical protein
MAISANALFHFTDRFDYLTGLLGGEIYPRYCLEKFSFLSDKFREVGIPMFCFSDIPLSQIRGQKINEKRKFAIGMSKSWAKKKENGVTPVLYTYAESRTADVIKNEKAWAKEQLKIEDRDELSAEDIHKILYHTPLISYLKPISKSDSGRGSVNVSCYDEREWRYVPKMDEDYKDDGSKLNFLTASVFKDKASNEKYQKLAKEKKIMYTSSDVRYIIIPNRQISKISKFFDKNNTFWPDKDEAMAKVIIWDNLKEDI